MFDRYKTELKVKTAQKTATTAVASAASTTVITTKNITKYTYFGYGVVFSIYLMIFPFLFSVLTTASDSMFFFFRRMFCLFVYSEISHFVAIPFLSR